MKTVTLQIKDEINDKFFLLLEHFSKSEIKILDESEYISDDDYLRSQKGMVESIIKAKNEPIENAVTLENLDW